MQPIYQQATLLLQTARELGVQLGTAESCTGGRIAAALTAIAGSSDCFNGGIVAYQNQIKHELLGVPESLLAQHGAVSEPVVLAMAQGARHALHADWAIATSGIAGPGGGTAQKPVGLVWFAVAGPQQTLAVHHFFSGNREQIQISSVSIGIELLQQQLQNAKT